MTSNPCNWVTIKEGCLTAQTPITNDDAKKSDVMFNMVGIVLGKIFLNITTLILSFVYNPNIQTGGILLLPQHYHKLLDRNIFHQFVCFDLSMIWVL